MENTENKKKVGRKKINPMLKKKACNILLSQEEIFLLEHLAAAYGLNKSSMVALLVKKLAPIILDEVEFISSRLSADEHKLIRLLNDKLGISPTREQAQMYYNDSPRQSYISQARLNNKNMRDDLKWAIQDKQDLEAQIENLNDDIKYLNAELKYNQEQINYQNEQHNRTLTRAQKLIDDLNKKLEKHNK